MPGPRVTLVIPTLFGGESLTRCVAALRAQTFTDFETVIVDNSGQDVTARVPEAQTVRVMKNATNVGYGAAINQAIRGSEAEFVAALNDDAYPSPDWLRSLVAACEEDERAGMCASRIRLASDPNRLDSAGLSIYGDGTTKQRGHRSEAENYDGPEEVLLPSGCAALFRRAMLRDVGGFDEDYFLYAEESDLGLRARLRGWSCVYVPGAVVDHDYSASSGRASRMKAFYVERNRLYTVVKNFPLFLWLLVPWYSLWRYTQHALALVRGRGLASEFPDDGGGAWQLGMVVLSAHVTTFKALPSLLRKRRLIQRAKTLTGWSFCRLLKRHWVSAAEIARQ